MDITELPKLQLEPARSGPWSVERFEITPEGAQFHNLRELLNGRDRFVAPGSHFALYHDERGTIMSDTPAEMGDHLQVMEWLEAGARTFLIHGLGLGMIATWLCEDPRVERVDVVEVDADVIEITGSQLHYDNLHIHHGDAFTYNFPPDLRWDAAWHDIWDDICSDNLNQMDALKGRYKGRVGVQGCWAEELCRQQHSDLLGLVLEVYRQRGAEIGDEAAAKAGLPPLREGAEHA